jgi:hypothetical protein
LGSLDDAITRIIDLVSEREHPMKTVQVGIVAALVFFFVADAKGQQYSGASLAAGPSVSGPISGRAVVSRSQVASGLPRRRTESIPFYMTIYSAQGQVLPYSYWVSAPNPARIYVEYGASDQFPFQGRAYGSPSDRWSWYYMGGGDSRYLAKYYYPPLR